MDDSNNYDFSSLEPRYQDPDYSEFDNQNTDNYEVDNQDDEDLKLLKELEYLESLDQQSEYDRTSNDYYEADKNYKADNNMTFTSKPKNRVYAGLLAIFLGFFGIHKFYLGYTKAGLIMLIVSVLTAGYGLIVMAIIGIVEGIIYLKKSNKEFNEIYVLGEKQWF